MKTGSFWIGGKHAVLSAIKNPKRKINKLIITQENQKDFNPKDLNKKILIEVKDKKEIDKIFINENIVHQGVAAEIESIQAIELKEYLKNKNNSKNTVVVHNAKLIVALVGVCSKTVSSECIGNSLHCCT